MKFDDAKKIVHELRLKSQNDWNEWCKSQDMKMLKIPTNPNVVYKNSGWLSYSDWLGTVSYLNKKNINYLTYTDCKKFIKKNSPMIPHTLPLVNSELINMIRGTIKDSMPSVLYMYRLNIFKNLFKDSKIFFINQIKKPI